MKYEELSDKDKVRLILQHVMGCWVTDITARGYHSPELPKGRELAALGFHWPLAYWNTDGEGWMIKDIATDAEFFDPLHDLNDAWLVVERMTEEASVTVKTMYRGEDKYIQCHIDFYADDQPPFHVASLTAPQAICLATLYAKGIIDYEGNVIEASE